MKKNGSKRKKIMEAIYKVFGFNILRGFEFI